MGTARSDMSIIASQSVDIEISTLPDDRHSRLSLNDRGHRYKLLQAFASSKLDRAQQQLHQLIELVLDGGNKASTSIAQWLTLVSPFKRLCHCAIEVLYKF